jgi:hypothetical protein
MFNLTVQGNWYIKKNGIINSATTASIPERLTELRSVSAGDGIHFNSNGYQNLAQRTVSCLRSIMTEKPKPKNARKHTFFWRGFRSPHGSMAANATRSALAQRGGGSILCGNSTSGMRGASAGRRSRSRFFHPYRRW